MKSQFTSNRQTGRLYEIAKKANSESMSGDLHWSRQEGAVNPFIALNKDPVRAKRIGEMNGKREKEKASKGEHQWQNPDFIATHTQRLSEEGWAAKGGQKMKGKLWWNNGVTQTRAFECPGEGWVLSQPPSRQSCYTPEANQKRKESLSGEKNPMFGRKHSKNNLEKMSVAMTGQFHWVNSQGKTCRSRECPGPGWQRGRKWRPQ
jgi:hypothetical protein